MYEKELFENLRATDPRCRNAVLLKRSGEEQEGIKSFIYATPEAYGVGVFLPRKRFDLWHEPGLIPIVKSLRAFNIFGLLDDYRPLTEDPYKSTLGAVWFTAGSHDLPVMRDVLTTVVKRIPSDQQIGLAIRYSVSIPDIEEIIKKLKANNISFDGEELKKEVPIGLLFKGREIV